MKAPRKVKFFCHLALADQVRAAMPVARGLIEEGINFGARTNRTYGDEVLVVLNDTRVNEVLDRLREVDRGVIYDAFEASRAIGIALGLMLRPEAFDVKGGR
jgi:hypothetical protein